MSAGAGAATAGALFSRSFFGLEDLRPSARRLPPPLSPPLLALLCWDPVSSRCTGITYFQRRINIFVIQNLPNHQLKTTYISSVSTKYSPQCWRAGRDCLWAW